MEKNKLEIQYIKKEELRPYANNAKIHTEEQIEQIKNSIREFGFNDPIAVWKDNEVIEGHGRLLAVMEMEDIDTVPVIRLDGLTDEQRKAYTIVHNKLAINTKLDLDILSYELKELVDEDFDITKYGFTDFEISILTGDYEPDGFDDEEIKDYEKAGEDLLQFKRVIISYTPEEEDAVKRLLGIEKIDKVVYTFDELLKE